MSDKKCGWLLCIWGLRFDIIGLLMLVIAVFLTIYSFNDFGIVAMYLVGAAFFANGWWKRKHEVNDACVSTKKKTDK